MLALAVVNGMAMAAFAAIYGAGALRALSRPAFLAALLVVFVGAVLLWVRVEGQRARGADVVSRIGRGAAGLVLAVLGLPVLVLMPLFALQPHLPADAGLDHVIARTMVLLLIALALLVLVNLVGALVIGGTALARRSAR
jgi:hypothetical protein